MTIKYGGEYMSNKLVYIEGKAFWMTPEGKFRNVEFSNGLPVEKVVFVQR